MFEGEIGYPIEVIVTFVVAVFGMLAIDLFAHRRDKPVSLTNALVWSAIWIGMALAFYAFLWIDKGAPAAALFLTGYALEKVLSVDNLMVFVAIFSAFAVPEGYRHRVLLYGVLGAIVFRLIFVAIGSGLYAFGHWIEFLFGAVIAWSAVQMLKQDSSNEEVEDYSNHFSVKWCGKLFPVWPKLHGHDFFVSGRQIDTLLAEPENATLVSTTEKGKSFYATPLFVCLIVMNVADVMFSFDSVPAVIAVTKDPLLVYSAMIFAILGLRQLYFVLEALERFLAYLPKAVIALLFFIAFKICLSGAVETFGLDESWKIEPTTSLLIVLGVLALGVVASLVFPPKPEEPSKEA
jgi:tellurite resistance protein TerC